MFLREGVLAIKEGILAVKGRTKIEILNNFRQRVSSNSETEFNEAVKQVKLIAKLRLEELNNADL